MRAPGLGVPGLRGQNRLDDVVQDLDSSQERPLRRDRRHHLGGNQESDGPAPPENRDRLSGPLDLVEDHLPQIGCADGSHTFTFHSWRGRWS